MNTLVMKFGGASVATAHHFSKIADLIKDRLQEFQRLVIVVSAMGDTTDQLIALAKQVNPHPPKREYDMLISVGERISISLLAMALAQKNLEAISFTGSQSGIVTCGRHTDARIIDVRPTRILPCLEQGKIVIVAGFQGVSQKGEITTLGRGGSDTTAVALGIALRASYVEFYKDVKGIYSANPKQDPTASFYSTLSYAKALEIVDKGAKILHQRCLRLASRNAIPLYLRSFQSNGEGSLIKDPDRSLSDAIFFEEVEFEQEINR